MAAEESSVETCPACSRPTLQVESYQTIVHQPGCPPVGLLLETHPGDTVFWTRLRAECATCGYRDGFFEDDDDAGSVDGSPEADFDVHWFGDEDEPSDDVEVFFSDEAAHDHQELVGRATAVIAAFPGVTEAYQQDREQIIVSGPALDPANISARLETWWKEQRGIG